MLIIISIMLTGTLAGYLLRKHRLNFINKTIIILVWLLLFLLGAEAGSNPSIMHNLHNSGLEALIITLAAVAGSVLFSWGLWYFIHIKPGKVKR